MRKGLSARMCQNCKAMGIMSSCAVQAHMCLWWAEAVRSLRCCVPGQAQSGSPA